MYIVSAPGIGKCKTCAMRHDARLPHDVRSVYYIVRFVQRYNREPDLRDAAQHCSEEVKRQYGIMDQYEGQET